MTACSRCSEIDAASYNAGRSHCRTCHAEWGGEGPGHCRTCHVTFNSTSASDAHLQLDTDGTLRHVPPGHGAPVRRTGRVWALNHHGYWCVAATEPWANDPGKWHVGRKEA